MSRKKLIVDIDERGVATVTLNSPDKFNVFDDTVIAELTITFEKLGDDKKVRVIILAAAGKNFCAGGDLAWMKKMAGYSHEENVKDARRLAAMFKTINFVAQPTVARVQGMAYGGGVGLISCCDMAVATADSIFCLSEVKVGLTPATISPYVIRAIGSRAARRYFTTAERFTSQRALQLGLISEVAQKENLDNEVDKLVCSLLANSPVAISQAKQLVFNVENKKIDRELLELTCARIADARVSEEGQEGLQAFFEKRKPRWSLS